MATKTLTFKFIKKAKFKLSKDNYVNKAGKKKVLGLQAMSIMAGSPYLIANFNFAIFSSTSDIAL